MRRSRCSWKTAMCWVCTPHDDWLHPLCSADSIGACVFPTSYLLEMQYDMLSKDIAQNTSCVDEACNCISPCFYSAMYWSPCAMVCYARYEGYVQGDQQSAVLSTCAYYMSLCCIGRDIYNMRRITSAKFDINENVFLSCFLSCCCWPCALAQTYRRLEIGYDDAEYHHAYTTRPTTSNAMRRPQAPSPSPSPSPSPYIPDSDDDTDI